MFSPLKVLWRIRLQKVLHLEEESFLFYRDLLDKNKSLLAGTAAQKKLECLMKEEKRHVMVALALLNHVTKMPFDEGSDHDE